MARILSTSEGTHRGAFAAGEWALFLSIGGIWGSSFLLIKLAVASIPPLSITAGRLGLGAVVLLTVARLGGGRLPQRLGAWRYIALFGLFGMVIPFAASGPARSGNSAGRGWSGRRSRCTTRI